VSAPPTARLFVALVPPTEVTESLAARVDATGVGIAGLRWTARANWHVTLAFLAAVPTARVEAAVAELAEVAGGATPFSLRLGGAGAFPRPARAGVVWAGVEGKSKDDARALDRLAKHVRIGLRRTRLQPDRSPFRPHLTLARVRPAADVTTLVEHLTGAAAEAAEAPTWSVTELRLVESRLGAAPGGTAAYALVASLGLGR
jgi:RNA 2',3'-cyclic 3'-phosphodiesterase